MDKTNSFITGQKVTARQILKAKQLRRAMTLPEKILWERLRNGRLGGFHFRRQQIIGNYIADFYCHAARLVVEVDGPDHDKEHDIRRDAVLAEQGLETIRFTCDEVGLKTDDVLAKILMKVRQRL